MFSRTWTMKSTGAYSDNRNRLKEEIKTADAIVIGAGAGLSTSAGFTYSGERFKKNFADFHEKYGITDMYSGGFYPYGSLEEYWAWWSRQIYVNRYDVPTGKPFTALLELVKDKDYFVLTTNLTINSKKQALIKSGCFIPRAITAFGNARKPATIRPMTMKHEYGRWSKSKRT